MRLKSLWRTTLTQLAYWWLSFSSWLSERFSGGFSRTWKKAATCLRALWALPRALLAKAWSKIGRLLRRPKPETQAVGLVSVVAAPWALLTFVKIAVVGTVVAYGAYFVGVWNGERTGYLKRDREVAAVTAQKNEQIANLNAELEAAYENLERQRESTSAQVVKSLGEIPPAVRNRCALDCSLPDETRKALESLE